MNNSVLQHSSAKREELHWINIAKGLAMIMVVYGHSGESFFLKPVYHIHLPIFLIISGYLMGSSNKWKNRSFQENMAKTASDLIYPYAVFGMISVIYRAISLPIQGYPPSDIVIYIRRVLLLDNDSNWFLPPLFFSKTLFTVLYHWMSRRKRRIIFVIGSSILGVDLFSKLYHIGLFRIFDGTMLFDNVYPCLAYLVLWLGRTLAFLVFLLIGFWLHGVLPRLNDQYSTVSDATASTVTTTWIIPWAPHLKQSAIF